MAPDSKNTTASRVRGTHGRFVAQDEQKKYRLLLSEKDYENLMNATNLARIVAKNGVAKLPTATASEWKKTGATVQVALNTMLS